MEKIETQLKRLTPELSMHESQVLWSRVETGLSPRGAKAPKRKGKRSLLQAITAGLVILGLLGGSVVTAYASEALPGDTLYSAKITIERAQIALAPVEKKKDLQLAFADRRVKEVTAVLADIEEDDSDFGQYPDPTLMAVSVPVPEASVTAPFSASLSPEEPTTPPPATFAVSAMMVSDDTSGEGEQNTRMAKSAPTHQEPIAPMLVAPASNTQEDGIQAQETNVKQGKRWKNLEKKKKALTVVIRELERSREELKESGAIVTSSNVDAVIVNLTELNDTGTTQDDTFVEKIQNSEVHVVPEPEQSPRQKSVRSKSGRSEPALLPVVDPARQGGAVATAFKESSDEDTQKELEDVKERNAKRQSKVRQVFLDQQKKFAERNDDSTSGTRVSVCLQKEGGVRTLEVLERNLPQYLDRGFVLGTCENPVIEANATTSAEAVTSDEKEGIIKE